MQRRLPPEVRLDAIIKHQKGPAITDNLNAPQSLMDCPWWEGPREALSRHVSATLDRAVGERIIWELRDRCLISYQLSIAYRIREAHKWTKRLLLKESEHDDDPLSCRKVVVTVNVDGANDGLHSGCANTVKDYVALGGILPDENIQPFRRSLPRKVRIGAN